MTKPLDFSSKSNPLTRAVLASSILAASLSFSSPASSAVLVINGSDQMCSVGTCGADGVEFQTDNTLIVPPAQNIGQTGGVSVTVTGGNNIGEILFQGTSTILGSVSLVGDILRLITVTNPGSVVTANGDVRVTTLSLEGNSSSFVLASGTDLTAQVNGSNTSTVTLVAKGSSNIIGDIGSSTGAVEFDLSPVIANGNGIVSTHGNIVGPVKFLNSSNQELIIEDGKNITGTVTTDASGRGTLTFKGSTVTGGDIGTDLFKLDQVNMESGTVILNNNIAATNVLASECTKLIVNDDVKINSGVLYSAGFQNHGLLQLGTFANPRTLTVGTYNLPIGAPVLSKIDVFVNNGGVNYSSMIGIGEIALFNREVNVFVSGNTVPNNTILTNVFSSPNSVIVFDDIFILSNLIIPSTATYQFTSLYTLYNIISIQVNTTPMNTYFSMNPLLSTIAKYFDTLGPNIQTTAPNLVPIFDALNAQPTAEALRGALASLTLPVNGNLLAVSDGGVTRGFNVISERMDNNRAEFARGQTRYKYANFREYCDQIPCEYSMRSGQWIEFYGSALEQKDHYDLAGTGYRGRAWTLIAGYDKSFYPSLNAGAAFAYSQMQTHSKGDINNEMTADSYQGYLYASHERCDGYYFDGILALAYNDYDQDRHINIPSNPNVFTTGCGVQEPQLGFVENANARFGGWQFNSYLEGGYQFRCKNFVVVPYGVWQTTYLRTNEFSEKNAPLAGFKNIQYDDMQEFDVGVGVKVAKNYICCKQYKFTPYVKVLAMHDFKNTPQKGISEFISGGPPLVLIGPERDADSLTTSLGLTLNRKDNSFLTLEYDFEKRNDFSVYAAFLKYRVEWC